MALVAGASEDTDYSIYATLLDDIAGNLGVDFVGGFSALLHKGMTCVCSVGLDMIALPGDTSAATLSAIIADEIAIGMVNNKTTAVRVIPVPGKKAGECAEFGGPLGGAPILPVNPHSSEAFIARGGRIPAPDTLFQELASGTAAVYRC
jgi:hypothetical protein